MEIRIRDIDIEKELIGSEYLGSGASKDSYLKNGIVYKVPRGRCLIQSGGFGDKLVYPDTIEEVDEFLEEVYCYEQSLVWSLGQFAIELIVWKALLQLEDEGYDLKHFARIKDFYLDKKGVIVIEQEAVMGEHYLYNECKDIKEEFEDEIDIICKILFERFGIKLSDIYDENYGIQDGVVKLFDFGLSSGCSIFNYGSYSEEYEEDEDYEDECY